MSPRAAGRLEMLGFQKVYDYVPGKNDWTAAGLPREGQSEGVPFPGDLARDDAPFCHHRDPAEKARAAIAGSPHDRCVVISDEDRIIGTVRAADAEEADDDAPVVDIMRPGPATVRANEPLPGLVERMREADVPAILVTTPEGRLLGLMRREEAEEALRRLEAEHGHENA